MKFADYKAFEMTADAVEKDMENFDRIAKTADAMRLDHAQFEAWAKLHHYDLTRCSHEPYAAYRSDLTNAALAGWRGADGESGPQAALKGDERSAAKRAIGYVMAMEGPPSLIKTLHFMAEGVTGGGASESEGQTAQRDAEISQLVDERDSFEHMGTVLAGKVSELLNIDVGEWSSANNPIFRAIHAIEDRIAAAPTAPQPTHYQQLLGVAYVVLGCLAANGVDIPERFLDAFSDPDSVENPLELLPCDFSPARAVRAAVEAAALTDEQREAIKYARSVMGSVSWETPDSIHAKAVLDALLTTPREGSC